jgi:hypothetical protein
MTWTSSRERREKSSEAEAINEERGSDTIDRPGRDL